MIDIASLGQIIEKYKLHFDEINQAEIYKWTAVKCFQDKWNPDAGDFKEMLLAALAGTRELMDTGNYFPKRMLTHYLNCDAEAVRTLFVELFEEDVSLADRIVNFRAGMVSLQKLYSPGKAHYHDPRAIMLYITLMYPDKYFLYKFEMFKAFAQQVGYPYRISRQGLDENVFMYQSLCQVIHQQVLTDNSLIRLHRRRLGPDHYADAEYHLLTQDIIYAASKQKWPLIVTDRTFKVTVVENKLLPKEHEPALKARQMHYIERAIAQKWLGDLGEQAVLDFEKARLRQYPHLKNKHPEPVSQTKGDGLGYDIRSFDSDGNMIYIEVKTTRNSNSPFYITNAELRKSQLEGERYYLYRLFEFNEKLRSCKMIIQKGPLDEFCTNPVAYYASCDVVKGIG